MSLLFQNADIVNANGRQVADILVEGEKITAIGTDLEAPAGAELIDCSGKLVFPGFVDPHTHIYLPFMGTYSCDDYRSASVAALCGGTTTLFDFCIPYADDEPLDAFEVWRGQAEGKACCDWSWHIAITRWDDSVERQLREVVARGVKSFKIFLAYKGALDIGDAGIYKVMKLAAELGCVVTAHCENAEVVSQLQAELIAAGKTGPEWHEPSRPDWVEADGTGHLAMLAQATGAEIYVVHLSNEKSLKRALEARSQGVRIHIETLIQYLLLDKTDAERPDFEGANFVMSPPLRDKANQEILWEALEDGRIQTLATDHAPFTLEQKKMGIDDFTKIPNGIPSLEDRVRLLYTHGPADGRMSLERFVEVASTNAAKIFGLYPRKGAIEVGSDADIVVYDPAIVDTLSAESHHMKIDYSAFEGHQVKGRCAVVSVRGQVQVRDGQFVGKEGHGRFLER